MCDFATDQGISLRENGAGTLGPEGREALLYQITKVQIRLMHCIWTDIRDSKHLNSSLEELLH